MNGDSYSTRDAGRHGSRDYPPPRRDRDDRRDRGGDRGDRTDRTDRVVRRRSRSPEYRSSGAAGRSRREEGDVDSYSSSRNHRDREREDRYSGRDRRGPDRATDRATDRTADRTADRADRAPDRAPDRGPDRDRERERDWDRDRGAGRSRRDHDDGGRRRDRDRDGADDRRAPRGGMDREFERERERRRSASPPPKKREPTPDLTDVAPILDRKRRLAQWDIKPPGYDSVTAEQAKLSGMFPLPGAPRQQTMDPTKLQALMTQPTANSATSSLLKPTNARQSKRLIVKNLPPSATEESVLNFFNLQLNGLNVIESTDPCALCQIAPDHSFAMLEFRNSGDTTVALALDGITMEADDSGADATSQKPEGLHIRRPKDYIVPAIVDDPNYDPDSLVPSSVVLDTPNKISLANIPPIVNEDQILELTAAFGKVKSFVLVKDNGTDESRGIAFLEYADPSVTDVAIEGLNGMSLGMDMILKARKASIGITQVAGEINVNAMSMLAGTTSIDPDVSRVLQLLNMVTPDELMDNEDYEEIRDDIQEECEKFGKILALKIPRPAGGSRQSAGVGRIFIKYETPESATKALRALAGRKFADRTVVATYFPEENFDVSAW